MADRRTRAKLSLRSTAVFLSRNFSASSAGACSEHLTAACCGTMGHAIARITLKNPSNLALAPIDVDALADTGALHLCIPEHIAAQLGLREIYQREVTTADGRRHVVPYVGPIQIVFGNRGCFGGAIVMGDQVLLGAVQMEDMDLIVSPPERKVLPNPFSPNIPAALAK